jgi:hypothetical protein
MAHTVPMPLPTTRQLRGLLESRLRREVRLSPAEPLSPTQPGLSLAVYVDDHLATRALLVADLPAAAYLGAASGLVPVGVATAALDDHALPPLLTLRFHDVLRACAPLFAAADDDRVRLYRAVPPERRAPRDLVALAAAPGMRLDLAVSVRAYGEGQVSLVLNRPVVAD